MKDLYVFLAVYKAEYEYFESFFIIISKKSIFFKIDKYIFLWICIIENIKLL